jgi:hypothetical protein
LTLNPLSDTTSVALTGEMAVLHEVSTVLINNMMHKKMCDKENRDIDKLLQ